MLLSLLRCQIEFSGDKTVISLNFGVDVFIAQLFWDKTQPDLVKQQLE